MTAFPRLMSPFALKGLELRNRIFSSGHETLIVTGGIPDEKLAAYHEDRARGGASLAALEQDLQSRLSAPPAAPDRPAPPRPRSAAGGWIAAAVLAAGGAAWWLGGAGSTTETAAPRTGPERAARDVAGAVRETVDAAPAVPAVPPEPPPAAPDAGTVEAAPSLPARRARREPRPEEAPAATVPDPLAPPGHTAPPSSGLLGVEEFDRE